MWLSAPAARASSCEARARARRRRAGCGQQQLDGDVASEALVARPPHFAHAAGAEPPLDGIEPDPVARLDAPPSRADLPREDVEGGRRQEVGRSRSTALQQRRRLRRAVPRRRRGADARNAARRSAGMRHARRRRAVRRGASAQWASVAAQRPIQPGPRERPVGVHRAGRDAQRLRRLLDREPAEEAQLDDLGLARILAAPAARAPCRRASTSAPGSLGGDVDGRRAARGWRRARRAGRPGAGARCPPARAASSRPTRRRSAAGSASGSSSQPSRRRHSSLTRPVACRLTRRALARQVAGRHAVQLVVDERQHALERVGVALAPGAEQARDLAAVRAVGWSGHAEPVQRPV